MDLFKINHSKKNNAEFSPYKHPRWETQYARADWFIFFATMLGISYVDIFIFSLSVFLLVR